jgi:hypothetical protein
MATGHGDSIIYTLLKDEVAACAQELGISEEQVTYGILKGMRKIVDLEFGHRPLADTPVRQDVSDCPLGLDCYPSCAWWSNDSCLFMEEAGKRGKQMKKTRNPYPKFLTDEASGMKVPDSRHEIWAAGYQAGRRWALDTWLAEYSESERSPKHESKAPRASLP